MLGRISSYHKFFTNVLTLDLLKMPYNVLKKDGLIVQLYACDHVLLISYITFAVISTDCFRDIKILS